MKVRPELRANVTKTLLTNSRLDCYVEALRNAEAHGFDVVSLDDFYRLPDRRRGRHFLLRHDVDWPGVSTRKMFEAELGGTCNLHW